MYEHVSDFQEQYVFCHDAIVEAIASGVTEVGSSDFAHYVNNSLREEDIGGKKCLLETQYEVRLRRHVRGVDVYAQVEKKRVSVDNESEVFCVERWEIAVQSG